MELLNLAEMTLPPQLTCDCGAMFDYTVGGPRICSECLTAPINVLKQMSAHMTNSTPEAIALNLAILTIQILHNESGANSDSLLASMFKPAANMVP